jgi:serine/threonine protein kinase
MSSLYNSSTPLRVVVPAGSSRSAIFEPDVDGFDVGSILAAANNEVPLIDPKQLKHDKSLGEGTTFDVHRELFSPTRRFADSYYVAVKYMRLAGKTREAKRAMSQSLMREIKVMTHPALSLHGCIVPLLGYGWRNDPRDGAMPYLITDYSEYGTLKDYLEKFETKLSDWERRELALDVAIGLTALHEHNIIHGDVKLSNVLVYGIAGRFITSRPQSAKLADFGSTIFQQDFARHSGTSRYLGTPIYSAPEFQRNDECGTLATFVDCKRADVYSFGLLTWETMASGKSYHAAISSAQNDETRVMRPDSDHVLQVLRGLLEPPLIPLISVPKEVIQSTLDGCLRHHPERRKTMSEIAEILSQGAE